MLDIKFIRENKDLVILGAKKKHMEFDIDKLISLDDTRKELASILEKKRAEQNSASELIVRESDPTKKAKLIEDMKSVKDSMQEDEEKLKEVMKEWQKLMLSVPNIPDMSVPEGDSDEQNLEIKTWGEIRQFNFPVKSHSDIMLLNDLVDFDRGVKVAGFRGYFLKRDAVRLQFALWNFVNDFFRKKGDFVEMIVPTLLNKQTFLGTGYIPGGEEDLYKTQDDTYLSGTAEVGTMGYFIDDVLEKKNLPMKMISFSPCFRREAGSHGKDTKGIMRVHEFYKLEQVVLCEASHSDSVKFHEEIRENSEQLLQALNLPYRVVVNCGGDLGQGQVKKYDIEVWTPSENKYRETNSASYFHDFQTRRLNIRYRDDDGKMKFVHSLNNTALSGRPLIMILENYQNEDGSVNIPEALWPYTNGQKVIKNF
jgi:seryl-tRNA synthetase